MKKQAIYIPLVVLLVAILSPALTGCLSVGERWETKSSKSYRDMSTELNDIADEVEAYCQKAEVTGNKCQSLKDTYNKMRVDYLTAGNTLKNSITAEPENTYYREKYDREIKGIFSDINFILKSIGG